MEKVALALVRVEMLEGVLCGAVRSQTSSEGPSLSSVAELVGGCGTTGGSRQQSSGEPTRMSNQRWDSL